MSKLIWLLGWALLSSAFAQPLKLTTGNDFPPYSDPRLPQGGFASALVQQVLDQAGLNHQLAFNSWTRGYQLTSRLEYDLTFPYVRTQEREQDFAFSLALFDLATSIVVLDQQLAILSAKQPQGLTLCRPEGYSTSVAELHGLKLVQPLNLEACLQMLYHQRVDGILLTPSIAIFSAMQMGLDWSKLVQLGPTLANESLHLMISHKHPELEQLLPKINDAISHLLAESSSDERLKLYLSQLN